MGGSRRFPSQDHVSFFAEDRVIVKQALSEKIATQPLAHRVEVFKQLDVCVEPVLSLQDALTSELAVQRQWVVNVPLADGSQTEPQLANPIKFSRSQARYDFVGQQLGVGVW